MPRAIDGFTEALPAGFCRLIVPMFVTLLLSVCVLLVLEDDAIEEGTLDAPLTPFKMEPVCHLEIAFCADRPT